MGGRNTPIIGDIVELQIQLLTCRTKIHFYFQNIFGYNGIF